jgi:hypothetical protein
MTSIEPTDGLPHILPNLRPLARLCPQEPRYARLQGQNLYLQHLAVAKRLAARFSRLPGVDMVLGLGSLARGFADRWSDLDLAVLGHGRGLRKLWRGEQSYGGFSVDLYVIDTTLAPASTWSEARRQALAESVVLFSRNRRLLAHLRSHLRLSRGEMRDRVAQCLFELGAMGYQPRHWRGRKRHGYVWGLVPDLWIRRGCLLSAHANADRALDMLLQLLFLMNGRLPPHPKWRLFLAPGLPWLPRGFSQRPARMTAARRDLAGYRLRERHLLTLVEAVVTELERRALLGPDTYRRFVERYPDYNS